MKRGAYIVIVFFAMVCMALSASAQKRGKLVMGGDNLRLLIDMRSTKTEVDSLLKKAGLKGANAAAILKGDFTALKKDGWTMAEKQGNVIEFDRPLEAVNLNPQVTPYLITTKIDNNDNESPGYPADVSFGINNFAKITVHELPSGLTRFFLPGYAQSKRVLLSGNFNNSIYFRYNYTFKLNGYANVHKITLAASFNDWDANNIVLEKSPKGWQKQLYLQEGTQAYRFLVDGKWITDPANPNKIQGADGYTNSVLNLGETVVFKLDGYTNAKKVYVGGSFNNWEHGLIPLTKTKTGWASSLIIPPGNYGYKFVVDDNWITDPKNPRNMMEGGVVNSYISVKPNYTFKLSGFNNAKKVHLAGSFNNFDDFGYTLAFNGKEWTVSVYLKPGKQLYKFIVDDKWMIDPGNKLYEPNQYNSGNSVLWIE
ncbi:glycogen-binding domain-containing protein [Mucilaginibacter rubeus]|uniref:glycogen-binding domain-containing protein n=1 Tax=Mucilaginibacter rubeus TaxID=2027860 RepID=UPI001AA13B28|nr:glycogen-binding domain-containing protein [Mucilaginibacter rubeus]QTE63183.1 glycogen-binding domain-containing protein [Mucilaginibacter rubeus]